MLQASSSSSLSSSSASSSPEHRRDTLTEVLTQLDEQVSPFLRTFMISAVLRDQCTYVYSVLVCMWDHLRVIMKVPQDGVNLECFHRRDGVEASRSKSYEARLLVLCCSISWLFKKLFDRF